MALSAPRNPLRSDRTRGPRRTPRRLRDGACAALCALAASALALGCRSNAEAPQACTKICARIVSCGLVKRARDAGVELAESAATAELAPDREAEAACVRECAGLDMARDAGTLARAEGCFEGDCGDFESCLRDIHHDKPAVDAGP